jgi:predicted transcriptional regulator
LIKKIQQSTDVQLLADLLTILEEVENERVIELTPEQVEAIRRAEQAVKEGNVFSEEEIEENLDQWLSK